MIKVSFVTGVALAIVLSGCSGKPSASDVKDVIVDNWSACKLVKVTDVKKTNGIERGNAYQMAVSYKLELLQDVAEEDAWGEDGASVPKLAVQSHVDDYKFSTDELQQRSRAANSVRIAAKERNEQFLSANCPTKAGQYFAFPLAFKELVGRALKQGEAVEVTPEFLMVKTENGWVIGR